ncbi:hypothetical protein SUGI_0184890 [Cryptomeria japonica]|nr:hypothetical protein SUGI_0184890 [Cryptomeria japonica]
MRFVALLGFALLGFVCSQGQELSSTAWLDGLASSSLDLEIEPSGGQICDGTLGECYGEENEWMMESDVQGRLLRRVRYYISYGALAANRVPCSPRSGRSYYTRNCHRARGPVNPYHRGCSAITRCRRYTS